jgi:hypothetical protein
MTTLFAPTLMDRIFSTDTLGVILISFTSCVIFRNLYRYTDLNFGGGAFSKLFGCSREEIILNSTSMDLINLKTKIKEIVSIISRDLENKETKLRIIQQKLDILINSSGEITKKVFSELKSLNHDLNLSYNSVLKKLEKGTSHIIDENFDVIDIQNTNEISSDILEILSNVDSRLNALDFSEESVVANNYQTLEQRVSESNNHVLDTLPITDSVTPSILDAVSSSLTTVNQACTSLVQYVPTIPTNSFASYFTVAGLSYILANPTVQNVIYNLFVKEISTSDKIINFLTKIYK